LSYLILNDNVIVTRSELVDLIPYCRDQTFCICMRYRLSPNQMYVVHLSDVTILLSMKIQLKASLFILCL